MHILIDNNSSSEEFPTLFGFTTQNKFAANALNFVYGIVMVVSLAFAYYALSLILLDWPVIIIFLAAIAVVGLPYCIKIIMYGRKQFTLSMAYLCITISILPTIFDFIGFYAKTSVRQSLIETKFEILEKINYFDKEARESINSQLITLEQQHDTSLTEAKNQFDVKRKDLNQQIIKAEQLLIDETEGVQGRVTSGRIGQGPRAKELEAELRKTQANTDLELKTLEENEKREIDKIIKSNETEKKSLNEGLVTIDQLTTVADNSGLVFNVSKAKTFDELANELIKLNTSINIISSKLKLNPEYVKFSTDDIIKLSFGALLRGDITAIICMTLAILLEIVDTIIVYMVRGERKKKTKPEEFTRNVRETLYY